MSGAVSVSPIYMLLHGGKFRESTATIVVVVVVVSFATVNCKFL